MNAEKIFARQVPPDMQESPLFLQGDFPEGVVFTGNRQFREHTTPAWDKLGNVWDIPDRFGADEWYQNLTEALNDLVPRDVGKSYTSRQVHEWKELLSVWDDTDPEHLAAALSLITCKPYECTVLRGCSQGDWVRVYYPSKEWTRESLDQLEAEYFNAGTEWIVHEGVTAPGNADDIEGHSIYCYEWGTETIKQELAKHTGVAPENVVLFEFKGYSQTGTWGAV